MKGVDYDDSSICTIDLDLIIHEYGHYVADEFGIYPFVAIDHVLGTNAITYMCSNGLWAAGSSIVSNNKYDGCALAWQEGWAHYFSIAAQMQQGLSSWGINGVGNVSFEGYHIELEEGPADDSSGKGEACELAVARVLWDMTDNTTNSWSEDNDPINWGYHAVWDLVMESGAKTFSAFMKYFYSDGSYYLGKLYFGFLLEKEKISANLMYPVISASQATIAWSPAYEDNYVKNDYYLDVYNSDGTRVYSSKITPSTTSNSTVTISGTTWTNLCANNSDGMYICIRTVPYNYVIGYTDTYSTGPYYSEIVSYNP